MNHKRAHRKWWAVITLTIGLLYAGRRTMAVEIPLESISPVKIGYIDLQKVFDVYPEKSFAEGDLLKEIERRRKELGQRQNLINLLRSQINADEAIWAQAKAGQPVMVPPNVVPEPAPQAPEAPPPSTSTGTVKTSTAAAAVEPYPMDDPLAGLPGHEFSSSAAEQAKASNALPGMQSSAKKVTVLDSLSASGTPAVLNAEALAALQKRIEDNHRNLERTIVDFKNFRLNAVGDMKALQTQKTYGVMAKIYAVLQTLARDEGITVVMDKAYVLYGEDTVDLSDKLISRLQQASGIE